MIGTQTPTQLRLAANRQVSRRDAILRSMALVHGELSVKAHILRGLWRSGQRAEAHVLLRFFTTGSFTRGSDGLAAPPRSIECRAVKGLTGPSQYECRDGRSRSLSTICSMVCRASAAGCREC